MILILDFGSQYTQLIARRIREANVYCEIHPYNIPREKIDRIQPKGIILSGSPASVYRENAPQVEEELFDLHVPFLGICYGMGIINQAAGGEVARSDRREYGPAELHVDHDTDLFYGFPKNDPVRVWMSHGDEITSLPEGWRILAHSANSPIAAFTNPERRLFGVQFHPEVVHTPRGKEILENFLFRISNCEATWTMSRFAETAVNKVKSQVGGRRVLCALSGGVDSSVTATLIHRAIGDRVVCIFVNNGLLRQGEVEDVLQVGRRFGEGFHYVDASKRFLSTLQGVEDPEEKRRRIGHAFIEVFEEEAKKLGEFTFLAQGTLYPDVIESTSFVGPSATIKTHHNVGGIPSNMPFILMEPLRELFKDEVRRLGQ